MGRLGNSGFTLIELVVVIALIAGLFVMLAPTIGGYTKISLNTASREIAAVFKEAYNAAQMSGRAYRMVYDLKAENYWVESGPSGLLLDTAESIEAEKRRKKFGKDKEVVEVFHQDKGITRKKHSLPRGVEFTQIYTDLSGNKEPIKTGLAYTHILPRSVTERTVIQLKDNRNNPMSLILEPILGNTRVERSLVDLETGYEAP